MRGRPKATKEDLEELAIKKKVDKYFEENELRNQTISGLAHCLGYACAKELLEDSKRKRGIRAQACSRIEEKYEKLLISKYSAGAKFGLQQFGWADTQKLETEVKSVNVNISLSTTLEDLTQKLQPTMPILEVQESAS